MIIVANESVTGIRSGEHPVNSEKSNKISVGRGWMTDGRVRDSHRRRENGGGSGSLAARSTRRAKLTELTLLE